MSKAKAKFASPVALETSQDVSLQPAAGGALVYRAHKIRLRPNAAQEQFFWKCLGTARFAYNWALAQWQQDYNDGGRPDAGMLGRRLNEWKRKEYPWMLEVPTKVVGKSVEHLGDSFDGFFKKQSKYPRFKSRHNDRKSAYLCDGVQIKSNGKRIQLPKIGIVRTFESLRWPQGKIMSCTLRREGERWFASLMVQIKTPKKTSVQKTIGVDLGLTSAVTISTGEKFQSPKPLRWYQRKLARLQRGMCRKQKGSHNREKARRKVCRLHWRIGQIRKDWQHKTTTAIAKRFGLVCIEGLNVRGMLANHKLARSISDVGWAELVRQLSYKAEIVKVGRFYPSSKTCSTCGRVVKELPLDIRSWACKCGARHDRDNNAAKNILSEGLKIHRAGCARINACGEESSGSGCKTRTKLASRKQESKVVYA